MSLTNNVVSEDLAHRVVIAHVRATNKTAEANVLAQRQPKSERLAPGFAARIAACTFFFRCWGALNRKAPFSIADAMARRLSTSVRHDAQPCTWLSTERLPAESSSPST